MLPSGAHRGLFGGSWGRFEELMGALGRSWGDLDGSRDALETPCGAHRALFGGSLGCLEELMGALGRPWGDLDGSKEALETPCGLHVAPAREIQRFYGPIQEPTMPKMRRGWRPTLGRGVPGRGRGGVYFSLF